MPTYPLPTLAPTISTTGISAPSYNDILQSLIASARSIFGADIYLEADAQDYQELAIFAMAINDSNQTTIAAYNSFAPSYAQGAGLSSLVKINGLQREASTNSTAVITLTGVAGTIITNGLVQDANGNVWSLPASVAIPVAGTIDVTATCQSPGAIQALANTISSIATVTRGWQSANNGNAATAGAPVETDADLRRRQAVSTSLPAQTPLQAIAAAIANVPGVEESLVYENQGGSPDANGVPSHSIAAVVSGGSVTAIAQVIEQKKAPGTGTYGTTSETVLDPAGIPITINFFTLVFEPIFVSVSIQPLEGYVATTGQAMVQAIVDFINALEIGEQVAFSWIYGAATLYGNPLGQTYKVTALTIGIAPAPVGTADITIPFNESASCATPNVVVTTI